MRTSYTTSPSADRPEWTAAKKIGDAGEQLVAKVLRSIGLLIEQHPGNAPHDLSITGRIEVKRDCRAGVTGNVALEISHKGRPSGIANSTATGWAIVVEAEVLLCPTQALRELVQHRRYRRVQAGENAVVALVPLADLRRIARSVRIGGAR